VINPPFPMKPTKEQFQAAITRIEKFSPAPRILARAMTLLREPQSDIRSIGELIGSDPALAADIIRCSNSVYYGSGLQIQSIDQAVQKVGFRETIRLLSLAVSRIVTGCNLASYGITADDFWAESLYNGLLLQELARETGGAEPDEAYTAGLLRYIGRLAINQSIHDLGGGLFWFGLEPLSQWEVEAVGVTHVQAGAILLRKWQFPPELVKAIEGQECPALLATPSWLAAALFFASSVLPPPRAGVHFSTALTSSALTPPIGSDFMHHNGLTPASVEAVLVTVRAAYEKTRACFG
jgi:HD-like signal output (HDOD) protein